MKGRRKMLRNDPLAVERIFDLVVADAFKIALPAVLYHYTTWSGAKGILTSKTFWATAHDCTNDEAEIVTADAIIVEVARHLLKNAVGLSRAVLKQFISEYAKLNLSRVRTVYLICFSAARDDAEQWRKYADQGRGVCLGVRVLDEVAPMKAGYASALIKVDYSEPSWRDSITGSLRQILSCLDSAENIRQNLALGLSAIHRIAGFQAITAKKPEWSGEQEYRHVTILRESASLRPKERCSNGKIIRYVPIELRAKEKPIAVAEIIIGPNQDANEARKVLFQLLEEAGYRANMMEYPQITVSSIRSAFHDW